MGTPGVVMHSAADIEGHMGTDGRYYLLGSILLKIPCLTVNRLCKNVPS